MSEMVDRVGAAILAEAQNMGALAFTLPIERRLAVAAIKAMRIPTKAMLDAVETEEEKRGYVASAYETMDAETAWPIMIAAALSGHEEKRNGG